MYSSCAPVYNYYSKKAKYAIVYLFNLQFLKYQKKNRIRFPIYEIAAILLSE